MIDNKKIEEAARGAADLYEQDLPMMSYDEDTEVDGQHHFCQEFGAELFKDGAKWAINEFLNDLLHPVEEIPEQERPVLVVYKHGGYSIEYWKAYNISGQVNYWTLDITQWLYVDDLFPKEGGEK